MINKTRIQTRDKFERRKGYMTFRLNNVDKSQLMNDDILVITCTVGANHYDDTIALQGFMKQLKQLIKMQRDHKLTEQIVIKCIQKIIDLSDLLINCTCADYCLHKDTKIKLLNNEVITVEEMEKRFKNNEEL